MSTLDQLPPRTTSSSGLSALALALGAAVRARRTKL